MRYSPPHRLFFVHIPKCAGLSVARVLEPVSDFPWQAFASDVGWSEADARAATSPFGFDHPTLGPLHQGHLPLHLLRRDFPHVFALLEGATSFAVVRNPRDRFFSALNQHLREFEKVGAASITPELMRKAAANVCDYLKGHESVTEKRYIHFARQSEFVALDGAPVVNRLFALERIEDLNAWLHQSYAIEIPEDDGLNRSRQPKKWFRSAQPVVSALSRKALPAPVRQALHPLWLKSGVYEPAAAGYEAIDLGPEVERFIAERYAGDAEIHARVLAGNKR